MSLCLLLSLRRGWDLGVQHNLLVLLLRVFLVCLQEGYHVLLVDEYGHLPVLYSKLLEAVCAEVVCTYAFFSAPGT